MAQVRGGQKDPAHKTLDTALSVAARSLRSGWGPPDAPEPTPMGWANRVELEWFRREALALIEPPAADAPPAVAALRKQGARLEVGAAEGKPVVCVDLMNTGAADADLAPLREMKSLRALDLSFCPGVTDDGLAHLEGMSSLEELHLDGTAVTDAGLNRLRGLRGLRTLTLKDTAVTSAGAGELQKILPRVKISR
jgi:hypothetical protein